MTSSIERRNKGKVPAQGYPQYKRLPAGQPFVMHEGTSSGIKPSGSTSLSGICPGKGDIFQWWHGCCFVGSFVKTLQFLNGVYSELPDSIKFILDNLHATFTLNHHTLFQKTLQALEIHLVNTTTINEAYISQLFGKEDIHSKDKMTIMGTDYARLSLKTQSL